MELLTGPWYLKKQRFPRNRGKVFSCFSCCGGSTMGYKLAGFDVIGNNEIDPKVAKIYKLNHKPKYSYVCSIREMLDMDLPDELYELDILDGSPPCTSFSMSGNRDNDWGKEKKFSEGQAHQRLDDLFFEFIALAKKLQPKIVIAENVPGIVLGKAKGYVKEIIKAYKNAGYETQIFRLNSAYMGIPQARDRIFFVSCRNNQFKKLHLNFNEELIPFGKVENWIKNTKREEIKGNSPWGVNKIYCWKKTIPGNDLSKAARKFLKRNRYFNSYKCSKSKPTSTLTAGNGHLHYEKPEYLNLEEWLICSSFPMDFNWDDWKESKRKWAMGMSVPPFMMQRISNQVWEQCLKNEGDNHD